MANTWLDDLLQSAATILAPYLKPTSTTPIASTSHSAIALEFGRQGGS